MPIKMLFCLQLQWSSGTGGICANLISLSTTCKELTPLLVLIVSQQISIPHLKELFVALFWPFFVVFLWHSVI